MKKTLAVVVILLCSSSGALGARQDLTGADPCQESSATASDSPSAVEKKRLAASAAAGAVCYEVVDGAVYMVYDETGLRLPMSGGGATGCLSAPSSPSAVKEPALAPAADPCVATPGREASVPSYVRRTLERP